MKHEGGAKVSNAEIEDLFTQLERDLPPVSRGGKRGRKMLGGGCTPEQRQRVRIAVAAALATGLYMKGPEVIRMSADGVRGVLEKGVDVIMNVECAVGARKAAIQNVICSKYAELLEGVNSFVRTSQSSRGAETLASALTGAAIVSAWGTFRTSLTAVVENVKKAGSTMSTGFETLVDEICKAMPAVPGDAAAAAAAPAPGNGGMGALAAAAESAEAQQGGRSRKSRKSKKRSSRVAKRTLRRVYRY